MKKNPDVDETYILEKKTIINIKALEIHIYLLNSQFYPIAIQFLQDLKFKAPKSRNFSAFVQSAEKPASPPKNKNPWKTAAFASNSQSNTEGGVPKTLFDVIQQAKSQSMENSSAPKTIFDVIQQAKAAKTNSTGDKTSLKTSAIIENVQTDHSPKQSSKSLWKTGLKKASLAEQINDESPHKASKIHWKENLEESSKEQSIDGEVFISAHPENISPKAHWKKALNMIAVEKWKAKLEEIERLAAAKMLHQLEIAENLPRKTTLVVSVIA